jgi:hypothetical protein
VKIDVLEDVQIAEPLVDLAEGDHRVLAPESGVQLI